MHDRHEWPWMRACCIHRALTCHTLACIQGQNLALLRMCTLLLCCNRVKASGGALQGSASLLNIRLYITAAGSNMSVATTLLLRKLLCAATIAPSVCKPHKANQILACRA